MDKLKQPPLLQSLHEAMRTIVLNPASALVVVIAAVLMRRSQMSLAALLNPWEMSLLMWLAGYAAVRVALLGFVDGVVWFLAPRLPPLPSRVGPKPVYQHQINAMDVTYLLINSTIEYVFAQQIGHLLWHAPFIVRAPELLGLLNGPLAFWLLLVVDDMLYAPLHRFMHLQSIYKYVHKHHHRNTYPARGYIDAAPPGTLTQSLLDSLERLCGGPVDAKAVLWRHWGTDPYTLGYVALWEPGDLTAVGPLHGTHEPPFYVAGSDHWSAGYMEGAVRTGRDAARAILGQPRPSLYVES